MDKKTLNIRLDGLSFDCRKGLIEAIIHTLIANSLKIEGDIEYYQSCGVEIPEKMWFMSGGPRLLATDIKRQYQELSLTGFDDTNS